MMRARQPDTDTDTDIDTPDHAALKKQIEELQRHNATLEAQVRQRTFELQVLYDLSHQIGYSLNYDELFRLMLQHLHRVVPYVVSGSLLTLSEPYDLFIQYTRPLSPALLEEIQQRMVMTLERMGEKAITTNQVHLRTSELGSSATRLPISSIGSVFQVPLIVGPQRDVVGLLFVGAEQDEAFQEEHVRLLYTVANQASVAIQQLRALLDMEEQRLESLVANLPDGIVLLDDQRRMVLVNMAGRDYLSLLAAPFEMGDVLSHLAQQSLEPLLQACPVRGHEVVVEREGEMRRVFEIATQPMSVSIPLLSEFSLVTERDTLSRPPSGWTLIIRDITGRKRAEEEIRNLNVELEQRVIERTAQLETANRDLRNEIVVRKQAEEDLRRERDLLRSIMETSPVGIIVADCTGQFVFANPHAERVLGIPRAAIVQRTFAAPEWKLTDYQGTPLPEDETAFHRVATTGKPVRDVEHAIECPNGSRGLLSINAAPLCDGAGEVERVVFTVRDVTRRVRAEEALRLSEAKLRLIMLQMPSILWTTNTSLQVTEMLGAGLLRFGYNQNRFIQQTIHDGSEDGSDIAASLAAHRRALRGLSAGYEMHFEDRDFEVRVDSLRDKEGQIIGCIGLALDITERKQVEEEIRTLNQELEQRVLERTAQLEAANQDLEIEVQERKRAEADLQEAWKAAEAATRAKSEFLANMSHEIRTPLNAVIGMTRLLLDTSLSPDQRDFIQTIRISGESLLAIINDVLDLSKIEAGKMELVYEPFDLRDSLEKSLHLVAARAVEKGLTLTYTIDPHLPTRLMGDKARLRQIFINLLSNAVKFTEHGKIVVSVRGIADGESVIGAFPSPFLEHPTPDPRPPTPDPRPRYEVQVSVRDTGIGIPPTYQQRLFQSFSQVDTSPTRKYGGTGLGLVISKNLAEMMGGRMWVESEEEKGSTFHFTFLTEVVPNSESHSSIHHAPQEREEPLWTFPGPILPFPPSEQGSTEEGAGAADSSLPEQERLGQRHPLDILLVEDNLFNQKVALRFLEKLGYRADVAENGVEALEALEQRLYDVVLMDVQMPRMDGTETTRRIRGHWPAHQQPRIIAMTAHALRGDRERFIEGGMDDYISKPVQLEELVAALERVSSRHPRQPQPGE
jgi:PAS domain S-box-containing protein